MNRINLLPETVVARQRRRRAVRVAAAAAAMALVVGTAWGVVVYRTLGESSGRLAAARSRLDQERQRAGKVGVAVAERTAIRALLARADRLANPVELRGVVTLLTHLLPESVLLTRLTIEAPAVDLTERAKGAGNAAPPPARLTRLTLEGVATTDRECARVVRDLSAHKAFANVTLVRSRPVTSGGLTRYAFELTGDVPPAATESAGSLAAAEKGEHGY